MPEVKNITAVIIASPERFLIKLSDLFICSFSGVINPKI